MSKETNLRYETIGPCPRMAMTAQERRRRIELDYKYEDMEIEQEKFHKMKIRAEWEPHSQRISDIKRTKAEYKETARDLSFTKKAFLMVRQDALRTMLDREYCEYEQELNSRGLAFYIKRE